MDQNTIIFLASVCLIFLIGKIFIVPIKKILKIVLNSFCGGLLIFVINLIGQYFNFHIGLNFVTSVIVGILGIPGIICLIILKLLL